MPISDDGIRAAFAQESDAVWLYLLTIDHDSLEEPIRVVNNLEKIISRGEEFIAYPFDAIWTDDKEDAPPRARLTIDNVSREIGQAIREIVGPPRVIIEVIRASDPDVLEGSTPILLLRNVSYDAATVTGELVVEDLTREPYPARKFTPGPFPGIFVGSGS